MLEQFYMIREQQRRWLACASTQSGQHLYNLLPRQDSYNSSRIYKVKHMRSFSYRTGWFESRDNWSGTQDRQKKISYLPTQIFLAANKCMFKLGLTMSECWDLTWYILLITWSQRQEPDLQSDPKPWSSRGSNQWPFDCRIKMLPTALLNEPLHNRSNNMACASSEDSD